MMTTMARRALLSLLLIVPAAVLRAQELPVAPAGADDFAKQLAEEGIRLDLARREVTVRGDLLLRRDRSGEYPVEYGIVAEGGRAHEAFGIVHCTPSRLNACFLALGLAPGRPRHRVAREPMPVDADLEQGLELPWRLVSPEGDRVFLYVTWKEPGADPAAAPVVRAFEDFFRDARVMKPLPMRGFVFVGSRFEERPAPGEKKRLYVADYARDLLSLRPDKVPAEDCLFDVYSREDEPYLWADADFEQLPPEGVALEFLFTLAPRPEARAYEPESEPKPIELPAVKALLAGSNHPNLDARHAEWIERLGTRDLAALAGILERGRQPELREVVAAALGASGKAEAIGPLQLSLRFDRAADVRLASAFSLAQLGSDAALGALIDVIDWAGPVVRDDAVTALRYASGEDFGIKALPWRSWLARRGADKKK